jgi:hypothetical protein
MNGMAKHEIIAQVIEDLDAIDFFDRVMFACGLVNAELLNNMLAQDKLLLQLERLDFDAYMAYLCDEQEILDKYYRKPKEVA